MACDVSPVAMFKQSVHQLGNERSDVKSFFRADDCQLYQSFLENNLLSFQSLDAPSKLLLSRISNSLSFKRLFYLIKLLEILE